MQALVLCMKLRANRAKPCWVSTPTIHNKNTTKLQNGGVQTAPYNKGLLLDSLFLLNSGLLSEVASPLISLNALYMYCCMALPAASSASTCKICTVFTHSVSIQHLMLYATVPHPLGDNCRHKDTMFKLASRPGKAYIEVLTQAAGQCNWHTC